MTIQAIEIKESFSPLALRRVDANHVQRAMDTPGGFAWWYLDAIDAQGDGLVLIWHAGLPFLPEARRRAAGRERPGINLALHRGGRVELYSLREHAPDECLLDPERGSFRFGDSRIELTRRGRDVALEAHIDEPLAGSAERVRARVRLRGPAPAFERVAGSAARRLPHRWSPISAAAKVEAEVSVGERRHRFEGRGYLDQNASTVALQALGIERWRWGRVAFPGEELIFYQVETPDERSLAQPLVLSLLPDGSWRRWHAPQLAWSRPRRSLYGPRHHRRVTLEGCEGGTPRRVVVDVDHVIDNGPFYLRFGIRASSDDGAFGRGVAELLLPPRVDLAWQRPFVRMRCHPSRGRRSRWLPLFEGPPHGRWSRLVRHWSGVAAEDAEVAS